MKNRTLLTGLVIIFVGLIAISLFQSTRPRPLPAPPVAATAIERASNLADNPDFQAQRRLFDFDESEVAAVNILDPLTGKALTFSRTTEGDWFLVEIDRAVSQEYGDAVARTAAILPFVFELDDITPEQYPEYGLTGDEIFLLLGIVLRDNERHSLAIGDVISSGDNRGHYALVDDRDSVYVIEASPIAFLTSILRDVYLVPADSESDSSE